MAATKITISDRLPPITRAACIALVLAAAFFSMGHAPYKQWDVYRKMRLIIVTSAEEPESAALGEGLAVLLATHLPSSRAMASRAPNAGQIVSLLGSHQLDLGILSVRDAREALMGTGQYAVDGPLAIRTLAHLGSYLFVAYDFPSEYACLIAKTLTERWDALRATSNVPNSPYLAGSVPVPYHAGALAFYDAGAQCPAIAQASGARIAQTSGAAGQREVRTFGGLFGRLSEARLNLRILTLALGGAFLLGAYHASAPGHGKTVLAAYFIGNQGTASQALLLGFVTTITHTIGVFALGFATLVASRYVDPGTLSPWLGVLSGLMLFALGVSLFHRRRRAFRRNTRSVDHTHAHRSSESAEHAYGHHHESGGHRHVLPGEVRLRDLVTLGVSGGLVPCPSALVVMLAAISVGQVGLGLILITAFSFGLAGVLIAIGLLMVYAKSFVIRTVRQPELQRRWRWERLLGPVLQRLPVFSAAAVAVLGLMIAIRTIVSTGLIP